MFVNAGDFYQGTIWYTKFKWKVVAKFANMLNFTAMVMILKNKSQLKISLDLSMLKI